MTYQDAIDLVQKWENKLIGKEHGDQTITNLIVVPNNYQELEVIIYRLNYDEPDIDILSRYTEFTVIALFDFPESLRHRGGLIWKDLNDIIDS